MGFYDLYNYSRFELLKVIEELPVNTHESLAQKFKLQQVPKYSIDYDNEKVWSADEKS